MRRTWWLLLILLALAACAPMQVGLETETPTVGATEAATETASPEPEVTATPTNTAPPRTAVVGTVTPSATVPSATPTASETPSVPPPTPTPPATATRRPTSTSIPPSASPTATSTQPPGTPMIGAFTADRMQADAGESIVLAWQATDTGLTRLHTGALDASGSLAWRLAADGLPANGTYTVAMDDVAPAQLFRLEAVGADGQVGASNSVSIQRRTCPQTYAFALPAGRFNCAAGPLAAVNMVEQVFEHGRLVRVETNEWLNPRSEPAIFVLTEFGTWVGRTNTWQPGEPESDPSLVPPEGRYQPVGSFGELWRDELRDQFGWALGPEQSYTGAYQYGYSPQPGHEIGAPGWYAQDLYLRLANGDWVRLVWGSRFTGQTWELLPQ